MSCAQSLGLDYAWEDVEDRGVLRRHGKLEGWLSLWLWSRVAFSSECSYDTQKDLADMRTMLHWF